MPLWFIKILSDPVAASWAQAAIYFATLFVLIVQARILIRQNKSQQDAVRLQTDAMRQAEYLRCQIDFTETMRLLISTYQHSKIYDELANSGSAFCNWSTYSDQQKQSYAYIEMLYELFERVFAIWKEGWISNEEWHLWETWILDIIGHPLASDVYRDNVGMFDPAFESYIRGHLKPADGTSTIPITTKA
jgi:hypothetical protein